MSTLNTPKLSADAEREAAERRGKRIRSMQLGHRVPLLGVPLGDAIAEHESRGTSEDVAVVALLRGQASVIPGESSFPPAAGLAQQQRDLRRNIANEQGSISTVTYPDGHEETLGIGPAVRRNP